MNKKIPVSFFRHERKKKSFNPPKIPDNIAPINFTSLPRQTTITQARIRVHKLSPTPISSFLAISLELLRTLSLSHSFCVAIFRSTTYAARRKGLVFQSWRAIIEEERERERRREETRSVGISLSGKSRGLKRGDERDISAMEGRSKA